MSVTHFHDTYHTKKGYRHARVALVAAIMFLALLMTLGAKRGQAFEASLPPVEEAPAFRQYKMQPKSELAKINFLFNHFSKADLTVIYDQREYQMKEAIKLAKDYLYKHYHKEPAEYWIKNYCYKSNGGAVIKFKDKDGVTKPLRDVALEELRALEKV